MTEDKLLPKDNPKEESPAKSYQPTTETNKATPKKMSRRTKLLIIGVVSAILIALAAVTVSAFLLLNDKKEEDSTSSSSNEEAKQVEEDVDSEDGEALVDDEGGDEGTTMPSTDGERQIAYMKNNNIWVMNIDGSDKTQITSDGDGDATRYTAMKWRTTNVLGYAKCDGACNIYIYDLTTNAESLIHTPPPFTQGINDIAWTHDAAKLGYIFVKADYSREAVVIDGATTTSIETFAPPPARGGGYNDGIQIRFSPDDTKVLVLNTIVPFGDNTVIADNIDGTNIVKYSDASFPTFDGNDGFYFKHDGKIKKYTFASGTVGVTYNFAGGNGYNLETSPDRNFIAFWDEESDGSTQLLFHDVAGSPALITNDFANSKWLDSNELVSIKTKNGGLGMGFESDGLYRVERVGGDTTLLDNSNIYNFEIEPE